MENVFQATGKRKRAIASVIVKPGSGKRVVNGSGLKEYIKSDMLIMDIEQPFTLLENAESYDVAVRVKGGGLSGQAGAIRLGISRALAKMGEENRVKLRKEGLLTRDARVVERKKYGMAKARKSFQFSKR